MFVITLKRISFAGHPKRGKGRFWFANELRDLNIYANASKGHRISIRRNNVIVFSQGERTNLKIRIIPVYAPMNVYTRAFNEIT